MTFQLKPPQSGVTVQDAEQMMVRARTQLLVNQPFFATVALLSDWHMETSPRNPTMMTDGTGIWWNHEWVNRHNLDEVKFVICHEILHIILLHCFRGGNRNPAKWRRACDYVVNYTLIEEKIGTMPKGGLHNPQLYQAGQGMAEKIYDLLPDEDGDNNQPGDQGDPGGAPGGSSAPGQPGQSMDNMMTPSGSQNQVNQKEAQAKLNAAQAHNMAKAAGKLSENMKRLLGEMLKPHIDWRTETRQFQSARAKVEVTWAKPKRRFLADDIYLPSRSGEKLDNVVWGIDCSGSVLDDEMTDYMTNVQHSFEDLKPRRIDVLYFDSEICNHQTFHQGDDLVFEPKGGGGTRYSPIFRHIEKCELEPSCVIILTDMECNNFGPPPPYPVLWISTKRDPAPPPFGRVVFMDRSKTL